MLPLSQSNDDERRLTGGLVSMMTAADMQQPQRSSPKATGTARRNRRKADLSLEALSYDDEDEITVPTFGTTQCNIFNLFYYILPWKSCFFYVGLLHVCI